MAQPVPGVTLVGAQRQKRGGKNLGKSAAHQAPFSICRSAAFRVARKPGTA